MKTDCLLIVLLFASPVLANAQSAAPLHLVQTIPLPNVKGRIDHMDVDVKGKRLFVAGLENGSVEVVDLQAGKWVKSIPGFQKPQGIAYVESLNKVFVGSGDDGMLSVFRADTLGLLDSIKLDQGPNRVTYDTQRKLVYVGYGGKDADKDFGEVGIIDAKTDKRIGDVQVAAHPAELLLDTSGNILFVFVSAESKVQVIDTKDRKIVSAWPVSSQRNGDGAFDERTHRLFIGTRTPPEMIAMDSKSGKEVAHLPTVEGWTASISMPRTNEFMFLEAEVLMPVTSCVTSKRMRITTKPSGKSRRGPAPVRRSGRRNWNATMWPRPLTTTNRPRFSCSNQSPETLLALLNFLRRKEQ